MVPTHSVIGSKSRVAWDMVLRRKLPATSWDLRRFSTRARNSASVPQASAKKAARAATTKSKTQKTAAAAPPPAVQPTRTTGLWLALPIGILSLIIVAPLVLLLVAWVRNRRAAARDALGA